MAANNSGMTAGTYYLKGGDNGRAYNENKSTLLTAFGSSNCDEYGCYVSGLEAIIYATGDVYLNSENVQCRIENIGQSTCLRFY